MTPQVIEFEAPRNGQNERFWYQVRMELHMDNSLDVRMSWAGTKRNNTLFVFGRAKPQICLVNVAVKVLAALPNGGYVNKTSLKEIVREFME